MDGELSFEVDHREGLITVLGSRMWSPERTETHFRDLERAVLKVRREHGEVRVLVDLREASVQMPQTAAVVLVWTTRIYQTADRVAVVCASGLLALQIKRAANVETMATFHELEPAKCWIEAGS